MADPPYNTGSDRFVYPDNYMMEKEAYEEGIGLYDENGNRVFKENSKTNPRFHSDWCSMIYPRLILARNLLAKDGIIFISIDSNEQENLKKICDEVFGASNFLTCVTRSTGTPTGGGFDGLVNELDYMLIYAKNTSEAHINGLPMSEEDAKIYDQIDEFGRYLIRPLRRTGGEDRRQDRPTMYFPLTAPDGTIVYPIGPTGYESRWICAPDTAKKMEENNLLAWKKTKRQGEEVWQVYQKYYLENRTKAPGNLWSNMEGNKKATRDIRNIFDSKKIFDFPKPIGFLKKVLQIGSDSDSIVLDFFSGSATTAHAMMQINAEDGGHRKFIMVQLPEETDVSSEAYKAGYKTICEIGKERIRRAGDKIIDENKDTEGLENLDVGFRVFKIDESNMKDVYYSADQMTQDLLEKLESNIKEDRTDLDLLYGCLLEWGLPLSFPYSSREFEGAIIHIVNDGDLVACFNENISEAIIREIAKSQPLRVVFRDRSFENSPAKINVEEIFKLLAPNTRVKVI